ELREGEAPGEPMETRSIETGGSVVEMTAGSAGASPSPTAGPFPSASMPTPPQPIEQAILAALSREAGLSLADLRRQMSPEQRGREFDEAVLRLDDQQRVILHRDADPMRFSEAERAELVRDGSALFTTITKRG